MNTITRIVAVVALLLSLGNLYLFWDVMDLLQTRDAYLSQQLTWAGESNKDHKLVNMAIVRRIDRLQEK